MNRRSLAGLMVLNAALLLVLGVLCLTPEPAQAQGLGAGRGDYFMIAGLVTGQTTGAIYVLDITSARMVAVTYDQNQRRLVTLGARDINQDLGGGR